MIINALDLPLVKSHIKDFDTDESGYIGYKPSELGINGDDSNTIYCKDAVNTEFKIQFSDNSKDCKVFFGKGVGGVGVNVVLGGSRCIVYFGSSCRLKKGSITVCDDDDAIIIGNNVTTMFGNTWTTGYHSGVEGKLIVVGDDCMFSNSISIRASDGHPVFSINDQKQINAPLRPVVIEPHCWIGQGAMIMKNVKLGACSIVAAGAVVTKSCRRYSLMSGVPARRKGIEGTIWARNHSESAKLKAQKWLKKYPEIKQPLSKRIKDKLSSFIFW